MSKHTPGPFVAITQKHHTGRVDIGICEKGNAHRWIARICSQPEITFENEFADAHLLAAAPEMLESLKDLAATWSTQGWTQEGALAILDRAYSVIRKAEGNEK